MVRQAQFLPGNTDDVTDIEFDTNINEKPMTAHDKTFESIIEEMSTFEGEVYIHCHKQHGSGQESMELVGKWPVDYFGSIEDLLLHARENYGGGAYRLTVYKKGHRGCIANKLYKIAEPQKKVKTGDTDNTALNAILQRMERQDQVLAKLYERQNIRQEPQFNRQEFLQEMIFYKQLFDKPAQSGGVGQLLESVEALKLLGVNVGVPGVAEEKEDSLGTILEKALPVFQQVMSQPVQPVQPTPQTASPNYKPNPQARPDNMQFMMDMKLKVGISSLLTAAKKGADPGLYADWVQDQLDEDTIKSFLDNPEKYNAALNSQPECVKFKPWFDDVYEHLKGQFGMPSKFSAMYDDLIDGETNDITPESDDVGVSTGDNL